MQRRLAFLAAASLSANLVAACSGGSAPSAAPASSSSSPPPAPASSGPQSDPSVTPAPTAADPIGFRAAAKLHTARALPSATKLNDGSVLVAGGEGWTYDMIDAVERYDPSSDTFREVASLPEPRVHHTATLLDDGRVLVAGGGQGTEISLPSGDGVLATAVIYDPQTDKWSPAASMNTPRAGHRAVRLADGRVLVAGGGSKVGYSCAAVHANCTVADSIASAEIYDPRANTWTNTGDLAHARLAFSLDVTQNGTVIAAGGAAANHGLTSVEIFDPATGSWKDGPALQGERIYHASVAIDDRLMVAGGKIANVAPITNVDILGPGETSWKAAASLKEARTGAGLVLLASGRVLIVGGNDQNGNQFISEAAVYDLATDQWTAIGALRHGRYSHRAITLDDGSVIVIGGRDAAGAVAQAERTKAE